MTNAKVKTRLIAGLSGRFGNRLLQHIDAIRVGEVEGFSLATHDKECARFIKMQYAGRIPEVKRNWMLSEVLYREPAISIAEYFYTASSMFENISDHVAIHFRGTDFYKWKNHSIIKPDFFIQKIERLNCQKALVVTDDLPNPLVAEIISGVRALGIHVDLISGNPFADFIALLRARTVIASPSTFSLAASILGGKSIIFPRTYAEIEAASGAEFWKKAMNDEKPHYVNLELA